MGFLAPPEYVVVTILGDTDGHRVFGDARGVAGNPGDQSGNAVVD